MLKKCLSAIFLSAILFSGFPAYNGVSSLQAQAIGGEMLTPMEEEIVKQINLARMDPYVFIKDLERMRSYYKGNILELPGEFSVETKEGVAALDDALKYLKKSRRTFVMTVSKGLTKSAKDHVKDQINNPEMSFDGTDGITPHERMSRYGKPSAYHGENIGYGALTARGIVALFILADGQPDRGLRNNLFNPKYKKMGIACGEHKHYKYYCVVDFAASYAEQFGPKK